MEKCYKILRRDMTSYRGCKWALGEWKESDELGPFCAPGGFHGYEYPLLAALHSPIHGATRNPRLFEAEADGEIAHEGQMQLKAQRMRIVREIPVPKVSMEQRIAYAIYCAKAVYYDPEWDHWADAWLSGEDRSKQAAADAGDRMIRMAEEQWWLGNVVHEAWAAACAAWAAADANERWAAEAAEYANIEGVDLIACAERAMKEVEA